MQDLSGWPFGVDLLLHVVVPVLALLGWLAFGPRPRVGFRVVLLALIYPVVWLGYTLVVGAVSGWYPYPFLDVGQRGGGAVAVASLAIALLIFALATAMWQLDHRLRPTTPPRAGMGAL